MKDKMTIQLTRQGSLILPEELCDTYNLQPGDSFSLLDLDGVFVISPRLSEIDALADRISQDLQDQGETLEGMQQTLREERETD